MPSLVSNRSLNSPRNIKTIDISEDFPLFSPIPNTVDDNFGDRLSYILVGSIVGSNLSLITNDERHPFCKRSKLLAIGSAFEFACQNDVIWGSGILNPSKFSSNSNSKVYWHMLFKKGDIIQKIKN